MATKCAQCPLRRRPVFKPFSAQDLAFMESFKVGELTIDKATPFMMEGANSPQLFTALTGMGLRYKTLEDGRRQILNFVMPGDFIGLQAAFVGEMQHSVESTTAMTLCVFDRAEFRSFLKRDPARAYDVTWLASVEEHFLGETIATLGQRTARERIAWALVKIFKRGESLGLTTGNGMRFPFRQQDLADALGLSLVHTNKTLSRLREAQIATWGESYLRVLDIERLAQIAVLDDIGVSKRPLM